MHKIAQVNFQPCMYHTFKKAKKPTYIDIEVYTILYSIILYRFIVYILLMLFTI